jgi:hypothetical protein
MTSDVTVPGQEEPGKGSLRVGCSKSVGALTVKRVKKEGTNDKTQAQFDVSHTTKDGAWTVNRNRHYTRGVMDASESWHR